MNGGRNLNRKRVNSKENKSDAAKHHVINSSIYVNVNKFVQHINISPFDDSNFDLEDEMLQLEKNAKKRDRKLNYVCNFEPTSYSDESDNSDDSDDDEDEEDEKGEDDNDNDDNHGEEWDGNIDEFAESENGYQINTSTRRKRKPKDIRSKKSAIYKNNKKRKIKSCH